MQPGDIWMRQGLNVHLATEDCLNPVDVAVRLNHLHSNMVPESKSVQGYNQDMPPRRGSTPLNWAYRPAKIRLSVTLSPALLHSPALTLRKGESSVCREPGHLLELRLVAEHGCSGRLGEAVSPDTFEKSEVLKACSDELESFLEWPADPVRFCFDPPIAARV